MFEQALLGVVSFNNKKKKINNRFALAIVTLEEESDRRIDTHVKTLILVGQNMRDVIDCLFIFFTNKI